MPQQSWFLAVLPVLLILLAHLAGLVVSIILLVRHKGTAAVLALIGFAVRLILDLASFGRPSLTRLLAQRGGVRGFLAASTGVGCCCSVIDVVAIVCIIVALWQALSGGVEPAPDEVGEVEA